MDNTFTARLPHPFYGDHVLYHHYSILPGLPVIRAWEFNGWQHETMSWKTGCYIHAGLSDGGSQIVKGTGAKDYLQRLVINNLDTFPIGSMKHGVMLTDEGLIHAHGIIERQSDDEFHCFAGAPPGPLLPTQPPPGVEISRLEAEVADPQRTPVTLRWNHDDVADVYASLMRPGPIYKPIDLPYAPQRWPMAHADHVTRNDTAVGWSSGTIYSHHHREFLSLGCIDLDATAIGTEVVVHWGDHGGTIKELRATVGRFPYLAETRNSEIDVKNLA
jgi:hypothetical protein